MCEILKTNVDKFLQMQIWYRDCNHKPEGSFFRAYVEKNTGPGPVAEAQSFRKYLPTYLHTYMGMYIGCKLCF
jgi:hypothetical protein